MTAKDAFRTYLKSLSNEERNNLFAKLISRLEVSPSTINNWRYGLTKIKSVYRREISNIIGKDIFKNVTD